jgi:hypothetical protein
MSGSSKTPIYGPEPWATRNKTVWSYWDLWFGVVALADYDGALDELAVAIEEGGRLSGGGTAEAKLSHLDDLRRRMAQAGIDAQTLVAGEDTDPKIRAKARAKVLKQALYPRDMTEPMWHPPRERLYERALHGRWSRFPVSPEPFYERLCNGLGEGFRSKGQTFGTSLLPPGGSWAPIRSGVRYGIWRRRQRGRRSAGSARPVMTIGLLTTRVAIDPVGSRGRLRDRPVRRTERSDRGACPYSPGLLAGRVVEVCLDGRRRAAKAIVNLRYGEPLCLPKMTRQRDGAAPLAHAVIPWRTSIGGHASRYRERPRESTTHESAGSGLANNCGSRCLDPCASRSLEPIRTVRNSRQGSKRSCRHTGWTGASNRPTGATVRRARGCWVMTPRARRAGRVPRARPAKCCR